MKESQQNCTAESSALSPLEERMRRLRKNFGLFTGIDGLIQAIRVEGASPENFLGEIESPSFTNEVLVPMLTNPKAYHYPLGLGLAHHTVHTLPDIFRDELAIKESPGTTLSVARYYPGIESLCAFPESNLRHAAKEDALTVINDALLVKYVGMKAAICLQSFTTEQGTFIEGNWYVPYDKPTHEKVKDLYFQGLGRPSVTSGTWTLSREYDKMDVIFLHFAQHVAQKLPPTLPGTEASRRGIEERYKGAHIRP